jgi:hypothetical protein
MASQKVIATYYRDHLKGSVSQVAKFLGISWDEAKAGLDTFELSGKVIKRGAWYSLRGYLGKTTGKR